MMRNILSAFAALAAALMLFATLDTAEARRGYHGGSHSFRSFSAPRMHSFRHSYSGARHYRAGPGFYRRGFVYGGIPLVTYGGYRYYRGNGCYWLKERALYTGSPYWWRRYQACRSGVYY